MKPKERINKFLDSWKFVIKLCLMKHLSLELPALSEKRIVISMSLFELVR